MSREKALVKNSIIISIGTFLPKLVSLITLPIVTAGLTKAEYCTYDLITIMCAAAHYITDTGGSFQIPC